MQYLLVYVGDSASEGRSVFRIAGDNISRVRAYSRMSTLTIEDADWKKLEAESKIMETPAKGKRFWISTCNSAYCYGTVKRVETTEDPGHVLDLKCLF